MREGQTAGHKESRGSRLFCLDFSKSRGHKKNRGEIEAFFWCLDKVRISARSLRLHVNEGVHKKVPPAGCSPQLVALGGSAPLTRGVKSRGNGLGRAREKKAFLQEGKDQKPRSVDGKISAGRPGSRRLSLLGCPHTHSLTTQVMCKKHKDHRQR